MAFVTEEIALEKIETSSMAMYVSKKSVIKDYSTLPLVARCVYYLADLSELVREHEQDPIRQRTLRHNLARLNELNRELRLPYGSRNAYEGDNPRSQKIAKQRSEILLTLATLESTRTEDRLESIKEWATPYVQTVETLTAYRGYRYEKTSTHTIYIEEGVTKPHLIVLLRQFNDMFARQVIEQWCGK